MPSKNSGTRVATKTSSTAAFAASSETSRPRKSSIVKSSFSPARLQLSLFASVIELLNGSQQLRIHDTLSGRLKSVDSKPRTCINCISWGRYAPDGRNGDSQPAKKKRKYGGASGQDAGSRVAVVAIGTNSKDIDLFAPLESKIVTTLKYPHGTMAFEFRDDGSSSEAWSLGVDGSLMEWNLAEGKLVRTLETPTKSIQTFTLLQNSALAASNSTFLLDLDSSREAKEKAAFPGFKDAIHSLIAPSRLDAGSSTSTFLAAAGESRYINVYDIRSATLVGSLIADSSVEQLTLRENLMEGAHSEAAQPLAAVTKDGKVDLFSSPFGGWAPAKSKYGDLKAKSKQRTRKPETSTQVIRSGESEPPIPVLNVSFQDSDMILALAEGGPELGFERVPLYDQHGKLSLPHSVTRQQKKSLGASTETMNGVKDLGHTHLDEARTVVVHGADVQDHDSVKEQPPVIEISSANEESVEDLSSEEVQLLDHRPTVNGARNEDDNMTGIVEADNQEEQGEGEADEPSFGDLLRMKSIGTVDVSAALPDADDLAIAPAAEKLDVSTNLSLGTVLSQSLQTNDAGLLESCFRNQDLQIVRATIERLRSDMAITLLQRLAEKLHSRPGRAGSLLVWVQWTLVAHGGYLASRPDVVKKLSSLHTVIRERAKSLQPLLFLKGKLDMLEAQINLRKSLQRRNQQQTDQVGSRAPRVYVEGEVESSTDSDEEKPLSPSAATRLRITNDIEKDETGADESEADIVDTMDVDEDQDDEEDSEAEDFIDDEASESGISSDEDLDDEVDYDDVDSVEGDEDEPPATLGGQNKNHVEKPSKRRG